jgi:RNA polymerase sigma factor (sigma-70 family)
MVSAPLPTVLRHLRRLVRPDAAGGPSDAQLLKRFAAGGDEAAFELLVWRHGPMVLGVCRRLLRHAEDAEDAFQATFLVLVRKAASVRRGEAVGGFLYRVAYRVALAARARAARRAVRPLAFEVPAADEPLAEVHGRDLGPVLDDELRRLPDRYRVPVVLCYLEGKTVDEAARELGCPRGTVGTRLARARERLRRRLTARGLALSAGGLLLLRSQQADAAGVPAALVAAAVRNSTPSAAGGAAAAVPVQVTALTEGVLRAMFLTKVKIAAAVVLGLAAVTAGLGALTYRMQAAEEPQAPPAAEKPTPAKPVGGVTLNGWGTILDPSDDCRFLLDKDKLTLKVPGSDHALCIEQNRMNAPRVLREVEGDFIVQVKVSGEYPNGSVSVVPSRRSFHGAGLVLWQDENNYIRLERAKLSDGDENTSYGSFELRKDGQFERVGTTGEVPLADQEAFLRLERHGDKVLAAVGADGIRWTWFEPLNVALARKLKVGLVAGHNTSTGFAPEFSEYKLFREAVK